MSKKKARRVLPKAEKVKTAVVQPGIAIRQARKQNESLTPSGRKIKNVIENFSDESILTNCLD